MRRASVLAQLGLRAANAAGSAQAAAAPVALSALEAATTSQQQPTWGARSFAAGAAHGSAASKGAPTILQKVMPQIAAAIPKGINAVTGGVKGAVHGLLTSGAATGVVSTFADKVLVAETFLALTDVDLPMWASWLATSGYDNKAGWQKIAAAAHSQLSTYSAAQVAALVDALHTVGCYNKALFADCANVVKAKFTEFETPALAKLAIAFCERGHYEVDLFDDIADGMTYCNHFFAPMEVPITDLAGVFAAYAKYHHDRADLFVMLSRAVTEDRVLALESDAQVAAVTSKLLKAFDTFGFYPDATEGLFVVADVRRPDAFSPAEKAEIAGYVAKVEALAGGTLSWYRGGYADPEHFHGAAFSNYNLWVARDELYGQTYKPSDVKAWKQ